MKLTDSPEESRAEIGRVVEIRSPDGRRRYHWAEPGDLLVLHQTLPFPYIYQRGVTLQWRRDGDLIRVNDQVVAVDLSRVPLGHIESVASSALKAGARCAYWRGSLPLSNSLLEALKKQAIPCVGLGLNNDSPLDKTLPSLGHLASRLQFLDATLLKPNRAALTRLAALRVLIVHTDTLQTSDAEVDEKAVWNGLRDLTGLVHLRVEGEKAPATMMDTLRNLPHLRRLELPRIQLGRELVEICRRPRLVSLTVNLPATRPKTAVHPGQKTRSALRELHTSAPGEWKKQQPLQWLGGLGDLRVLDYGQEDYKAPLQVPQLIHLEVLSLRNLSLEEMRSPLPRTIRILEVDSLTAERKVPPAPALLRRLPELSHLVIGSEDLRGNRSKALRGAPGLVSFQCEYCIVDDAALKALGQLNGLASVELAVGSPDIGVLNPALLVSGISNAGVRHLAGLTKLKRLSVAHTRIDDGAMRTLSRLGSLEGLDLSHTETTDRALEHLGRLQHLRWLSLRATRITSLGISKLGKLRRLRHLDVSATATDDRALDTIARMRSLRWLSLEATHLTGKGLKKLRRLTGLQVLKLAHATLPPGVLAREGLPPSVRHLDVSGIPLSAEDMAAVGRLRLLDELWAINCQLGGDALRVLASAPRLTRLVASVNNIGDKDLPLLLKLPMLRRAALNINALSTEKIEAFQRAHPRIRLRN